MTAALEELSPTYPYPDDEAALAAVPVTDQAEAAVATVTALPGVHLEESGQPAEEDKFEDEFANFLMHEDHPELGIFVRGALRAHRKLVDLNVIPPGSPIPLPLDEIPCVEYWPMMDMFKPADGKWQIYRVNMEHYRARRAKLAVQKA